MQVHPGFIAAGEASLKLMRKKQFKIMQLQGSCDNFYLPMTAKGGKKGKKYGKESRDIDEGKREGRSDYGQRGEREKGMG
jgi:hypothetical protein